MNTSESQSDKAEEIRLKVQTFGKWWLELAQNLVVVTVLLALAERSQSNLLRAFAGLTALICAVYYLTYLLFQLGPTATWQRLVRSVVYVLMAIAVIYAFQYAFATLVNTIEPLE
jgi:hypothetical protein